MNYHKMAITLVADMIDFSIQEDIKFKKQMEKARTPELADQADSDPGDRIRTYFGLNHGHTTNS